MDEEFKQDSVSVCEGLVWEGIVSISRTGLGGTDDVSSEVSDVGCRGGISVGSVEWLWILLD